MLKNKSIVESQIAQWLFWGVNGVSPADKENEKMRWEFLKKSNSLGTLGGFMINNGRLGWVLNGC
jgi:hypothetical protein